MSCLGGEAYVDGERSDGFGVGPIAASNGSVWQVGRTAGSAVNLQTEMYVWTGKLFGGSSIPASVAIGLARARNRSNAS